jgi:hypothetical protein
VKVPGVLRAYPGLDELVSRVRAVRPLLASRCSGTAARRAMHK